FSMLRPKRRLPASVFIELMSQVVATNPAMVVPLELAAYETTSFGGYLANAMKYAPTVRSALELYSRYSLLHMSGLRIAFIETASSAVVTVSHPIHHAGIGELIELVAAHIGLFVKVHAKKRCMLRRVAVRESRTGFRNYFERFFQAPVTFLRDTQDIFLVWPRWVLGLNLRHECDTAFTLAKAEYATRLRGLTGEDASSALSRLEAAVATNAQDGIYDAATLAKAAGMSVRTAQRLAARNSLSLRAIVNRWRINAAKGQLLGEPELTISEIAASLSYADDRSFRRAFKRSVGLSPTGFRKQYFDDTTAA
ncbi:MAG: helix-turn-helix domain-containing protein, partial [Myxococcota bacterium]